MPGPTGPDPAIHRRRLRAELRRAREAAGRTQRDTATAMDWSLSKLIRIETGDVRISTNDLKALLGYYEVPQERIDAFVEVARAAREPAHWSRYRDVASPEFLAFLGYESAATIIRNFEPLVVPGLLQTEEYAREAIAAVREPQHVDALVDLRMERQELLVRENPPGLHFIIDEAVIRRTVGNRDIMRRQLAHLKETAALPHVHLRIVPFAAGLYPQMFTQYVVFEFERPEDESILYIEDPVTGEMVIRESTPTRGQGPGPQANLRAYWRNEQLARTEDTPGILDDAMAALSTRTEGIG